MKLIYTSVQQLNSYFLRGNYAPADGDRRFDNLEVRMSECMCVYPSVGMCNISVQQVVGVIPEGFDGLFARVGPNPRCMSVFVLTLIPA
jgi:hypothetical protein